MRGQRGTGKVVNEGSFKTAEVVHNSPAKLARPAAASTSSSVASRWPLKSASIQARPALGAVAGRRLEVLSILLE